MIGITTLLAAGLLRPDAPLFNLDAWRAKDEKGQSCASCHAPDGIDISGFNASDVDRRIARHQKGSVAQQIRHLILDGDLKRFPGPERPMQPGNTVLTGSSPALRDAAFLANLEKQYPNLFAPVRTFEDAKKFEKTILDIDLRNLPIGIEMNRLSEDGFHGADHASIANWFPDVATFDSDAIRAESDAYLAHPDETTLAALDAKVVSVARQNDAFSVLSLAKYRSLLVLQHEMRTGGAPCAFVPPGNPYWQVAEFGRIYAQADPVVVNVPNDVQEAKKMGSTFVAQLKQIRLPWFWLGWVHDPSLTKSGALHETIRGDYFCRYLEEDGPYMGHEAFMLTRKLAEQERNPISPKHAWEIQYSFFLANTPLIEREPKEPTAQKRFRTFVKNSFMMSLMLLEDDLKTRKRSIRPVPQANQIKFVSEYLNAIKQPEKALIDRVLARLAKTPDR